MKGTLKRDETSWEVSTSVDKLMGNVFTIADTYNKHLVILYQSEAAELWPILKEFAETGEVKG